jgi:hypothetical protein
VRALVFLRVTVDYDEDVRFDGSDVGGNRKRGIDEGGGTVKAWKGDQGII